MSANGLQRRTPVACGALGRYDSALVAAIARAHEPELREAHRDRSSVLMLDREPLRWRSRLTRGFAWSEGTVSGRPIRSWPDAACELNAAGLVVGPRSRFVHSSVSGVAPVYCVDHGDATYFSSRIEPLVRSLPMRFTVDWDAWASILVLLFPVEGRTPFAEIRRLQPFSAVERTGAGGVFSEPPWPWAEIEPVLTIEEGLPDYLDAMREVVDGLPPGPVSVTLSGGLDSRLVTCFLLEGRNGDVSAITLADEDGRGWEEAIAAEVAREFGMPHEVVLPGAHDYARRWADQAAAMDFQNMVHLWLSPIAPHLPAEAAFVSDGLGLDTLAQPGDRTVTGEMLNPDGGPSIALGIWRRLRWRAMRGKLSSIYDEPLRRTLAAASRRSVVSATKRVRGHTAEALLATWLTRTVRAVSVFPHSLLGANAPVVALAVDHRAASALLRISPKDKFGGRFHPAAFDAIHPAVGRIPSTGAPAEEHRRLYRRQRPLAQLGRLAPESVREHARLLRNGPLTPHLAPELRAALRDEERLREALRHGRLNRGATALMGFHLWHERYRDRLREVDPADLLG